MFLPTAKPLLLLPILLMIAACSEPEEDQPVGADLEGDIIFSSNRTGAWEIYMMDIAGGNPVQITENNYNWVLTVKFSPDGSRIYFSGANTVDNQQDIFIMNRDGTDQINLTDSSPESEELPYMSPDGQYIVYTTRSLTSNQTMVIIMNSDGSNKRRLAESFSHVRAYDYSPAGDIILCMLDGNIYRVPTDGSTATNLTNSTEGLNGTNLIYSPDGNWIAFTWEDYMRSGIDDWFFFSNIFIMDADGGNLTELTAGNDYENRFLGFSPDGEKMLFSQYPSAGGSNPELIVMRSDGTNAHNITNSRETEWFGQFIDGTHIVYEVKELTAWNDTDYNIYIIDETTGRRRQLTEDTADDSRPNVFMR
jgi:Tol biopolymer transport system component